MIGIVGVRSIVVGLTVVRKGMGGARICREKWLGEERIHESEEVASD